MRERNGEDVRRAVPQRTRGLRQATGARVLHDRLAEQQREQARQVEPRNAGDAGDLVRREFTLEVGFDVPERLFNRIHGLLTSRARMTRRKFGCLIAGAPGAC